MHIIIVPLNSIKNVKNALLTYQMKSNSYSLSGPLNKKERLRKKGN